MTYKIVYIDDDERDQKKYKTKFEADAKSKNKFEIVAINTPKTPQDYDSIIRMNPDLLLVDYILDIPEEDKVIGVSGVALSTELKQKIPGVPIVLFTRKTIFGPKNYIRTKETFPSVIDEIIYKKELFQEDSSNLENIYRLASGYNTLKNLAHRTWVSVLELIGAPKTDRDPLEQSNPPFDDIKNWSPSSIAVWIRETLIKYPGILYDAIHAATLLGISEEAFLSEDLQEACSSAKYTGPFETLSGRWWKSIIQSSAYSMMNKKGKTLPLREGFPQAWERVKGQTIDKSKCIFSGESPADWVCCILHKPVLIKYSLSYTADNRPQIMDESRVSFEAIRTTNDWDEKRIDLLGRELIPQIRNMAKPGG